MASSWGSRPMSGVESDKIAGGNAPRLDDVALSAVRRLRWRGFGHPTPPYLARTYPDASKFRGVVERTTGRDYDSN